MGGSWGSSWWGVSTLKIILHIKYTMTSISQKKLRKCKSSEAAIGDVL